MREQPQGRGDERLANRIRLTPSSSASSVWVIPKRRVYITLLVLFAVLAAMWLFFIGLTSGSGGISTVTTYRR